MVVSDYAAEVINWPLLLHPEGPLVPREQRGLLPLVARDIAAAQTGTELVRPVTGVRADGRELLTNQPIEDVN
ncbi:hypothetical protein AB8O64_11050 [Streptomyces sp. QH1-20]|uniref:hypothetical protein n=1 Tax=Streptomyces sp. QH1-20 TaxID=3240934 RepID=UPI00351720A6